MIMWVKSEINVDLESFKSIHFGKMVQQSLDMRWHGWSLRHVTSGCMESSLIRMVLDLHLFTFRSDKTVAATDSVWCSYLLSGGTVIIGKIEIIVAIRAGRTAENTKSYSSSSSLFPASLLLRLCMCTSWLLVVIIILVIIFYGYWSWGSLLSTSSSMVGSMMSMSSISFCSYLFIFIHFIKQKCSRILLVI